MKPRPAAPLERLLNRVRGLGDTLAGWVPGRLREGSGGPLPRIFWAFFVVFAGGMVLISLVGDQGLIAYWRLTGEARDLRATVERMERRRGELERKIRALNHDPAYIEQVARRELGLVRPGEIVLQLPPADRAAAGEAP